MGIEDPSFGEEMVQALVDYFKDNWESKDLWEAHSDNVWYSMTLEESLADIDKDVTLKLAMHFGLTNQAWIDSLKQHLKELYSRRANNL
jgi:hypothetical protein